MPGTTELLPPNPEKGVTHDPITEALLQRLRVYVAEKEKRCMKPGCPDYVPAGVYPSRQKYFFCSETCRKWWFRGKAWGKCAWCGQDIRVRTDNPAITNHFCNPTHNHLFRSDGLIRGRAGVFMPLLEEYENTFVKTHYRKRYGARNALSYFFQFLNEQGISDVQQVTPKTISRFLAWEVGRGKSRSQYISYVSMFFDWLIAESRREHANPVVSRIHSVKPRFLLPRPYREDEMSYIWQLLDERGNSRLRLAVAIGEETGLRIGEVCNLRMDDVDLVRQTIFVRLPNKTMHERNVFFHEKTKRYLSIWMAERDPKCGHDHLLHNSLGRPCTPNALHLEFRRVLCKFERSTIPQRNETGLDRFCFHRLRHLMASRMVAGGADAAAIMSQGGWTTSSAMCGYAQVPPDYAAKSYHEAMERANARRKAPCQTLTGFESYRQSPKDTK